MNNILENEDKMISFFLKSVGPWKKYLVIGGGFAPIIYKLYLSNSKTGILPVSTRDLDSLIPQDISKIDDKKLSQYLIDSGFKPFFNDLDIPATESYIKKIEGNELEIEFLTSCNFHENNNKNIKIAGIVAQPFPMILV